jgi:hypothetical protein
VLIGFLINPFQIDSQTFLLFSGRCEAILNQATGHRGFLRTPKLVNWYFPGFPGNFLEWTFVIIPNTTSARDSTSKAKATKADFWMWELLGIVRLHCDAKRACSSLS